MIEMPVTTGDLKEDYEIIGPVFFQISNKGIFLSALDRYSIAYANEIAQLRSSGKMDPVRRDWGFLYGEWSVGQNYFEQAFYIATQELKKKAAMLGANAIIGMRQDIDLDTSAFQYFYLQMYGTAVKILNEKEKEEQRIEQKKREIQAKREQERLAKEKEDIEREKAARAEALAEKLNSALSDERVIAFLKGIQDCNRYMSILTVWKESGMETEPAYEEVFNEIKKRADIERMYGPGVSSEKAEDYAQKLIDYFSNKS